MQLIACDPATKKSAFAIFQKNKLVDFDVLEMDLSQLIMYLSQFKNFGLVVETQYSSFNAKTLVKLVEARMKIEMLALQAGCEYIYNIAPASWQKILSRKKMLRNERKELAKQLASKVAGETITNSDVADAVCLGLYTLQNYKEIPTKDI